MISLYIPIMPCQALDQDIFCVIFVALSIGMIFCDKTCHHDMKSNFLFHIIFLQSVFKSKSSKAKNMRLQKMGYISVKVIDLNRWTIYHERGDKTTSNLCLVSIDAVFMGIKEGCTFVNLYSGHPLLLSERKPTKKQFVSEITSILSVELFLHSLNRKHRGL